MWCILLDHYFRNLLTLIVLVVAVMNILHRCVGLLQTVIINAWASPVHVVSFTLHEPTYSI